MANETELTAAEDTIAGRNRGHREFFVPLVRAIAALGGRARKADVVRKLRELLGGQLTEKQLDYLENKNRFGWARKDLKDAGFIGGEYGFWELTPIGRAYAVAHAEDAFEITVDVPETDAPGRSSVQTEAVEVTSFQGYEIPLLEAMAGGSTEKSQIFAAVEQLLAQHLLDGDRRLMPNGAPVWQYRASWALTNLGKAGFAENVASAQWAVTEAGRQRLHSEREAWQFEAFRGASAKVRVKGARALAPPVGATWDDAAWGRLRARAPRALVDQLATRIRPDLGPSPDAPVARNVILYGPPGTGKTYLAKEVGMALVGDEGAERLKIVQFHPSYAYEDFIQGLRPDIKQTQLRYELHKGPFLRIAEDAAQRPDVFFVIIIDEINRGDPARIFGELLYALEYRDEAVELPFGGDLAVPGNLVVIGTMNSVDRSVALVDYALRRRFGFVRVDPNPSVIAGVRDSGIVADIGPVVLERFNEWLVRRLGREHAIGHSFFISASVPDDAGDAFEQIWGADLRPLLEEYFFGDEDGLNEASETYRKIVAEAKQAREDVQREAEADMTTETVGDS